MNPSTVIFGIDNRLCSNKPPPIPEELLQHNSDRTREHQREIANNEMPKNLRHPFDHGMVAEDAEEHFHGSYYVDKSRPKYEDYTMPHAIWTKEELDAIVVTHKAPERFADKLAYFIVRLLRTVWDLTTGYSLSRVPGMSRIFRFSPKLVTLRMVFLETVAGVPGMMFGMVRHLNSLRRLERDRGWIKTLLSEAENERMHLLVAMSLYRPGRFMRGLVVVAQGGFCLFLFPAYLISPRFCHSFVGYLEEQAVITYSHILDEIDAGNYPEFEGTASDLAIKYWKLPEGAVWRDVFAAMRADEANHRDVNQTLADLTDDPKAVNPFRKKH